MAGNQEYALIRRWLRHGDRDALKDLFGAYEDNLYRYLWLMLKQKEDAEDALQETYRKAVKALPGFRDESHFKSWLFRIGHNTAIDQIRKRKKVVLMEEVEDIREPSSGGSSSPMVELIQKERREELGRAVAGLPDGEREVVLMRFVSDLSFQEIAQIVGAPLGTVLARMHRAKQRLQQQLAPA